MKKCPRCNSISLDSEASCGVCGANLTAAVSESLEQLAPVHIQPRIRSKRKLNRAGLALIIAAVTMTGAGASLLVLLNAVATFFLLGIFFVLTGLVMMLGIVGGAGGGLSGGVGGRGKDGRVPGVESVRPPTPGEDELRRGEEERKRRGGGA